MQNSDRSKEEDIRLLSLKFTTYPWYNWHPSIPWGSCTDRSHCCLYRCLHFCKDRHYIRLCLENKNQSTVSTAKRLASLLWYLIVSTIDNLHNTINGYDIACLWNSKYSVHVCMIQTNADFIFHKLIVSIAKIQLNNYCRLQCF